MSARVTHVVDGDTIDVRLSDGDEDTVRYIGIDTPETVKPGTPVQCGGPRAHEVNDRLVYGKTVTLRFDAERRDVYGRLLAYVYLPRPGARPLFVNAELARRGLARTLTIPPNDSSRPALRPPRDRSAACWAAAYGDTALYSRWSPERSGGQACAAWLMQDRLLACTAALGGRLR